MIQWNKYIVDGDVKRSVIAADIQERILTEKDLRELVTNAQVKASFIGSSYPNKKEQSQWTEDYLDTLCYAAIAEAFNEDYLVYLDKVADYVVQKKKGNFPLVVVAVVVVLALMLVSKIFEQEMNYDK